MILTDRHTETNITTSRDGMPHFSWAHRQKRESIAPRKFTFTVKSRVSCEMVYILVEHRRVL